ncbi:MAG: sigma-54 dependent transcriptional regulator [Candidatus Neomarinimicrobiota bacterium]
MPKAHILLVDDDRDTRNIIPRFLIQAGYETTACESAVAALAQMQNDNFDMVLSDIQMPGMDGIAFLKLLKSRYPDLPVVLITGFATIQSAVDSIREGAEEYITKPYTEDEILITVDRVMEKKHLLEENRALQQQLVSKYQLGSIIGTSPGMQEVYALIEKAARNAANVMIYGDTGTGKELVAKAIHHNSVRAEKPYIGINCGAIPETLFESELFGYAKGAFTGANRDKEGLFEAANGGTLFLDEIGDLGPAVQVNLLRAIEERQIRRIGDNHMRKIDVRIIAATNKDLAAHSKENLFRADLFYRLHVIPIYLPPLRLRQGDIPLLVEHFLTKYCQENDKQVTGFSAKSMDYLMTYHWPGNVRELENVLQRMVALVDKRVISHLDLPQRIKGAEMKLPVDDQTPMTLQELERQHLVKVLRLTKGNRSKAARLLGIQRKTLYGKLQRLNISEADFSSV